MQAPLRPMGTRCARLIDSHQNRTEGENEPILSDDERARLAVMASIVRFKKAAEIYHEGEAADAVFNIITGVVKAYKTAPDGSRYISAFLHPDDLFGLAEEGTYANSTRAITPVTAYRLPVTALQCRLARDAELEFHVICKLCQELRHAQRHAILPARRDAHPKVAMFLQMLGQLQAGRGERETEIYLPMGRTEIGEYVGMSLPAVSRAFRTLTALGIIEVRDKRHTKNQEPRRIRETGCRFEPVSGSGSLRRLYVPTGLAGRPVQDIAVGDGIGVSSHA
jgi:CRP-like cAMP-binding protein